MRAHRYGGPDVAFFEVDQKVVLEFKRVVLERGGLAQPPSLLANYLEVDVFDRYNIIHEQELLDAGRPAIAAHAATGRADAADHGHARDGSSSATRGWASVRSTSRSHGAPSRTSSTSSRGGVVSRSQRRSSPSSRGGSDRSVPTPPRCSSPAPSAIEVDGPRPAIARARPARPSRVTRSCSSPTRRSPVRILRRPPARPRRAGGVPWSRCYQRTVARPPAPLLVPPSTGLSRRCASTPSSNVSPPPFSTPRL